MKKAYLLFALVTLITLNSFAWGREGHTIVAQMAFKLLSPAAQQNVLKALGGVSIDEAGPWLDGLRDKHEYDFTKPWHYINIEKGKTYFPSTGDNIVNELIRVTRELQHKNVLCADQVKMDLLTLFHLVGDIHQPLHTDAYEKGGNGVQVTFMGSGTNLHSVWDSKIIEREKITLETIIAAFKEEEAEGVKKIGHDPIEFWLQQSRAAVPVAYKFKGNFLDETYSREMGEVIKQLLLFASIRLAAILEADFGAGVRNEEGKIVEVAKGTIAAQDAPKYIGKQATVCGIIYGVKEGSKVNYINLGAAYPNTPLTIVIFPDVAAAFKTKLSKYDGNRICVTGILKEYKGRAEIVVSSEDQISVKQ